MPFVVARSVRILLSYEHPHAIGVIEKLDYSVTVVFHHFSIIPGKATYVTEGGERTMNVVRSRPACIISFALLLLPAAAHQPSKLDRQCTRIERLNPRVLTRYLSLSLSGFIRSRIYPLFFPSIFSRTLATKKAISFALFQPPYLFAEEEEEGRTQHQNWLLCAFASSGHQCRICVSLRQRQSYFFSFFLASVSDVRTMFS